MPSVALTYQKVLLLVSRFLWYVLGFNFTTRLIESCLSSTGHHHPHGSPLVLLDFCGAIVGLIFGAVTDAALLGILRQPDQAGRGLMWSSVHTYTWVLFRLIMLIGS